MVVLHEVGLDARRFPEVSGVEALVEIAAGVAEHFGFNDQQALDGGLDDVHVQNTFSRRMLSR